MNPRGRGVVLLTLFALLAGPVSADDWPDRISERLDTLSLPEEALALAAVPLDGPGEARFINADTAMNPGSTMKLVTTYAALELLSPTYKWHTRLYTDGELDDGVLRGNLYFVGAGDPKLTEDRLWQLMRDLRAYGVREIHGDLVLDDGFFRVPADPPEFDDDGDNPHAPYLVEPHALLTNLNLFHIQLAGRDDRVRAWVQPHIDALTLDNRVTLREAGRCPGNRGVEASPEFGPDGDITVVLEGTLPKGCRASRYLSLMDHPRFTAALLRSLWRGLEGEIHGQDRRGRLPEKATLLATASSPDLVTMVRDINKWSSNVMARQLFLTIGAENRLAGDPNDLAAADRALREWMTLKGLNTKQVVLDNGAGLSRGARMSPMEQIKMLQQAWRSPFAAELIASLPLVAMDGTMHNRLRDTGMRGEGHIKTGSLTDVRAVAGFTRDRDNTTWAVSAIINTPAAWKSQALLDEVLEAVYSLGGNGPALTQSHRASSAGGG